VWQHEQAYLASVLVCFFKFFIPFILLLLFSGALAKMTNNSYVIRPLNASVQDNSYYDLTRLSVLGSKVIPARIHTFLIGSRVLLIQSAPYPLSLRA